MSPSDRSEMTQLESLASELAEAGRLARMVNAGREKPEPAFAAGLRAELLRHLPAPRTADGAVVPIVERRQGTRPFAGPDRRWATEADATEIISVIGASDAPTVAVDATRAGKRWGLKAGEEPRKRRPLEALALAQSTTDAEAEEAGKITALRPSMRWHIPTRVLPSRYIAVGLAASVAVATFMYGSGFLWTGHPTDVANESVGATIVRGGIASDMAVGTVLYAGDEIKVSANGHATLQLGSNYVRLDSGADLRLNSLDPSQTSVAQIAGRVYHRSTGAGSYKVATADVTWQGSSTAFDLDRHFTGGGGEQVRGLALYNTVGLAGPQIQDIVSQGMSATVVLSPDGTASGVPNIGPIEAQSLLDNWLIGNAGLDARLGLPLGLMASVLSPEPTTAPTEIAPPTQSITSVPATEAPKPTVKPTAKPAPPGPAYLGKLKITRTGSNTYSFSWPKYTGSGFTWYKLVYEPWGKTPDYSKGSPYWACPDSASTTEFSGSIDDGDYAVRLQVVDMVNGKVVIRAETNVVRLRVAAVPPTQELGPLTAVDNGDGTFTFSWAGYGAHSFSYYKLVFETTASGNTPSYPDGSPYWVVPGTGDTSATLTVGANNGGSSVFAAGDYQVRIQAIGYPWGAAYVYGETTVLHLVVSA